MSSRTLLRKTERVQASNEGSEKTRTHSDFAFRSGNAHTDVLRLMYIYIYGKLSLSDTGDLMAIEKKKLTVNLSSEIVDVLRDLADSNHSSMTEELKKAISDRKFFSDKKAEGNKIVLEQDDQRTYVEFR
jgi:hypothetical protein